VKISRIEPLQKNFRPVLLAFCGESRLASALLNVFQTEKLTARAMDLEIRRTVNQRTKTKKPY
jgi:hypothetical protein